MRIDSLLVRLYVTCIAIVSLRMELPLAGRCEYKGTNISGNQSKRLQKVSDISQILS
jgi:hypothetical protein